MVNICFGEYLIIIIVGCRRLHQIIFTITTTKELSNIDFLGIVGLLNLAIDGFGLCSRWFER